MPPQHPLPSALLAVCFLGFAFCECEASNRDSPPAEVVGTPVTHNMLMGLNLCRTARLDVRLPLLESSDELEKQAKRVMMEKLPNREKCAESFTETLPAEVGGLFTVLEHPARVQYTEGLQKEVEEGLKALGSDYSATAKFNYRASPFSSRGAQNLAFLMSPKATRVGCVVSKNCSDYKDYLLCLFSPGLTEQEAPFTQSFYDALWARKNAGIDLVDLFISDYNADLVNADLGGGKQVADMLIGLNLCRTARLDVRLPLLKLSEELEKQAEGLMGKHLSDKANCHQAFLRLLPARVGGFFIALAPPEGARDYTEGIQREMDQGLDALGADYTAKDKFNPEASPFSLKEAQNLALLMAPEATEVGCARSQNCADERVYSLCVFSPGLKENEVPFTQPFYNALWDRKYARINLAELFTDDYMTDLGEVPRVPRGARGAATAPLLSAEMTAGILADCKAET